MSPPNYSPAEQTQRQTHKRKGPVKSAIQMSSKLIGLTSSSSRDYRWEELQHLEKKRREILLWVEQPTWRVLTHWNGTVLRIIATNYLLWLTMAIFVGMRLFVRGRDLPEYMGETTNDSMTVVGAFLSFFLVFYVNQNHKRFFQLYNDSMACKGRIFDVATLAVTNLPYAQATRLVRYMNAAHAAGYVGLSEIYPSGSYFNRIEHELGLLTPEERQRMDEIDLDQGGSCNRELIAWCMNEITTARKKGLLDPELANQFREQILQLRAKMGQLYNAKDLPIPFFYVHFICILTTLYLPLFAITSAIEAGTGEDIHWSMGVIKGLVVLLQSIFVIGLRVLGQKMSDPYGDDLIDLSVMHYVSFTWTHSNRILNSSFPEDASPAVESHLISQRKNIGTAWEPEKETTSNVTATFAESIAMDEDNNSVVPNPRLK